MFSVLCMMSSRNMLFMVFLCGVGNSSVDGGVLVECVCYVVSGVVVNVVSLIWCVGCV